MADSRYLRLGILLLMTGAGCTTSSGIGPTEIDRDELVQASQAYAQAWLSNDPEAVMATFVPDPVLSPSGLPFQEGQQAARSFWWPADGPPTTVTRFDTREIEVAGSGNLGYVRGTFILEFEYEGKAYVTRGKYLHLLKRGSDVGWRISHHFWNDLPRR